MVDRHFRQFSGHTQVNATDLRSLRYPHLNTLEKIADLLGERINDQAAIDVLVIEQSAPAQAH
jgi:adenine-specific DNA-methyltransferase